jgi:hypothetical protein
MTKQEQQSVQADPRAGKIGCRGQDAEKSTWKANSHTSSCAGHKSDSGLAMRAEDENKNLDPLLGTASQKWNGETHEEQLKKWMNHGDGTIGDKRGDRTRPHANTRYG